MDLLPRGASAVHGLKPSRNSHLKIVRVVVIEAIDLAKKDIFGLSDPYCKIKLFRGDRDYGEIDSVVTETIKKDLHPTWNQGFFFRVNPRDNRILFEVFDENRLTRDDFLGEVELPLSHLPTERPNTEILPAYYSLKPRSSKSRVKGNLKLQLSYLPSEENSQASTPEVRRVRESGEEFNLSIVENHYSAPSAPPIQIDQALPSAPSLPTSDGAYSSSPIQIPSLPEVEEPIRLSRSQEPLPEGWEERQDANGRTFYIDHTTRTTAWVRPTGISESAHQHEVEQNDAIRERNFRIRRHLSVDDTETQIQNTETSQVGTFKSPGGGGVLYQYLVEEKKSYANLFHYEHLAQMQILMKSLDHFRSKYGSAHVNLHPQERCISSKSRNFTDICMMTCPPTIQSSVNFCIFASLRRITFKFGYFTNIRALFSGGVDGFSLTCPCQNLRKPWNGLLSKCVFKVTYPARKIYLSRTNRRYFFRALRTDSSGPLRTPHLYKHDFFICPLQASVPTGELLPPGWAIQRAPNGRMFFIDHNTRKTTWKDPRLHHHSSQSIGPSMSPEITRAATLKHADLGPLPDGWEERVHKDGRVFYIDHNTKSTQWEDPRVQINSKPSQAVPYSRDFKRKCDYFRSKLKRPVNVPNKYEIHVRRNNLLLDSYRGVSVTVTNPELLKTRLWIVFDSETGLDYGGLQREWFYLLSKEVFNPYYGLFEYSASETQKMLTVLRENKETAKQTLEQFMLQLQRSRGNFFAVMRPRLKRLNPVKYLNRQELDKDPLYLHKALENKVPPESEDWRLPYLIDNCKGQVTVKDLKPGGSLVKVTNANKREYINLVIKWRFVSRVEDQMKKFMEGFCELIPHNLIQIFDERELELLMCGLGEIDINDWRRNTNYRGDYSDKHSVIVWFWKAVTSFDLETRARLLQFVTGTSRVPMNGFAELYGSNGPQKFTIEPWGTPHSLPRAHTCFNRLDLPRYRTYYELREKLRVAIENTQGFEGVD
ncbi:unnamed protein product [Porites evermanni]|uniref:HECT-type E3 ubiquitin transferase n=1 Tax=Porites evermanni TaxID=104178 RepID=A0ABN8S9L0_9CNID|nr:unnamed protein product [Porites evermanni]